MRAFVVGNIAIDETISVPNMPVAGASILGRGNHRDLGGKGANQAVVMNRAGVETRIVAAIGNDFRGSDIRERLAAEGLPNALHTVDGIASDMSMVFTTPDGENAIVTTFEAAENLPLAHIEKALAEAETGDMVVMQGNLSVDLTAAVLSMAQTRGLVTAVNPSPVKPRFAELWNRIDIAFLNEGEANELTGGSGEAAIQYLAARNVRAVIITLGAQGALVGVGNQTMFHVPAKRCSVVDTTGAGDTFMATALAHACLHDGALGREAIIAATEAAAITVGRFGTLEAFPSRADLQRILET